MGWQSWTHSQQIGVLKWIGVSAKTLAQFGTSLVIPCTFAATNIFPDAGFPETFSWGNILTVQSGYPQKSVTCRETNE